MAMQITVATDDRAPFVLPLSGETTIGTLKQVLQADTGIPNSQMRILFNGQDVQGSVNSTLASLGVTNGSLLYVTKAQRAPVQRQQQSSAASQQPLSPRNYIGMTFADVPPNVDPRILHQIIRVNPPMMTQLENGNPQLAAAAKNENPQAFIDLVRRQAAARRNRQSREQAELQDLYRRVEANPFDIEAQKRVEEIIRQRNVQNNHELARVRLIFCLWCDHLQFLVLTNVTYKSRNTCQKHLQECVCSTSMLKLTALPSRHSWTLEHKIRS